MYDIYSIIYYSEEVNDYRYVICSKRTLPNMLKIHKAAYVEHFEVDDVAYVYFNPVYDTPEDAYIRDVSGYADNIFSEMLNVVSPKGTFTHVWTTEDGKYWDCHTPEQWAFHLANTQPENKNV